MHWTLGPKVQAPDLARSMCCVLVQNTLPLQCLSSPRSINAGVGNCWNSTGYLIIFCWSIWFK